MTAVSLAPAHDVLPLDSRSGLRPSRLPFSLQSARVRLVVVSALCALAFHYSLASLLRDWSYDTPLSDLALVPFLALGLGIVALERHGFAATVRLGRLDVIVATGCLAVVAAVLVLAPVSMGNYYWTLRPDLLCLPLLVIAGVALLLGTRALLALLFPLGFLLLAWPLPFMVLLEATQLRLTAATGRVVAALLHVMPVGSMVGGTADVRIHVSGAPGFDVSVASACSGIEGLVGLGVAGGAALYLICGRVRRRLAWLAVAMVAAWLANVVRILAILGVGRVFGERMALDVLHPVAGLVLLNGVLVLMVLALPRFGLRLRSLHDHAVSDVPLTQASAGATCPPQARLWRRAGVLAAVAALLAVADAGLAATAGVYDNAGRPDAVSFTGRPVAGPGVAVASETSHDWAQVYFGSGSSWRRYVLRPTVPGGYTIWLDSIETRDVAALRAHPVATCYRFHRFSTRVRKRVPLSAGIIGQRFVYTRPDGAQWHSLTWEWPVADASGTVRHERIVLFASSLRTARLRDVIEQRPPGPPIRDTLLKVLDRSGPDDDSNAAVTNALLREANTLIALHVRPAASAAAPSRGDA